MIDQTDLRNHTFSTTEAAEILGMPVETLRTQLKRNWLPISGEDRERGQWRRISAEDLLRFRVAMTLSKQCVNFSIATRIVTQYRSRVTFEGSSLFLAVALYNDDSDPVADLFDAAKNPIGDYFHDHLSRVGVKAKRPNRFVVVHLNEERSWLMKSLDAFYRSNAEGQE